LLNWVLSKNNMGNTKTTCVVGTLNNLPDGGVYVGKGTKWDSPFFINRNSGMLCVRQSEGQEVEVGYVGDLHYSLAGENARKFHFMWLRGQNEFCGVEVALKPPSLSEIIYELGGRVLVHEENGSFVGNLVNIASHKTLHYYQCPLYEAKDYAYYAYELNDIDAISDVSVPDYDVEYEVKDFLYSHCHVRAVNTWNVVAEVEKQVKLGYPRENITVLVHTETGTTPHNF